MASFLEKIDEIRAVNWAPKHLWDVKFENNSNHPASVLPSPFTKWMPVSDITLDEGNLDSHSFELYNQSFELPAFTAQQTMTMTFYDSVNYDIFKWLRGWITQDILNLDKPAPFVTRLQEAVKTVHIIKLDSLKNVIDNRTYLVFPKQAINWEGTSQPAAQQYSITFVIAGSLTAN